MSQETPIYVKPETEPTSLSAFKNRPCARVYTDNYIHPTPEEVKALIKLCNWSQTQVAKLTGVTYNPLKGSSTVRKWQTTSEKEHRDIPYATWRLLLIYAGVVKPENDVTIMISRSKEID
jgi:hypothetical protein